ncbi:MAG: acyl-CoA thioesterase [Spirochaetales bacterium]|nr:acyl-CoA thioesterase [Spirochaetales bacterium]
MADLTDNFRYRIQFEVRDYECDLQGIVNNAVYQNYLEHARHQFLKSVGIDFAEVAERGINMVVVRAEVDYKRSLTSGDTFWIGIDVQRISRLKFAFLQEIFRAPDDELMVAAKIISAAVSANGRPVLPEEIHPAMGELLTGK